MTKTAPQRRSRVDRVIQFFREASKDEIKAVILLLQTELLIPSAVREVKQRRRRRLNGADVNSSANSQPDRAEGAGA